MDASTSIDLVESGNSDGNLYRWHPTTEQQPRQEELVVDSSSSCWSWSSPRKHLQEEEEHNHVNSERSTACHRHWHKRKSNKRRKDRSSVSTKRIERMTILSAALLLSFIILGANDSSGSSSRVAAFTNGPIVKQQLKQQLQHCSSFHQTQCSPFTITTSCLHYKNGADNDNNEGTKQEDIFTRSKRTKLSKRKRKTKLTKTARNGKKRSYRLHQHMKVKGKGVPASEEELAHHVQSVFSDLPEFDEVEEEDDEEDDDEPCILSEPDEDKEGSRAAAVAPGRQLDSCRKLDRHPALVLNADYQPLRMLPLSIWSWQDTVKAVLSGKAVVVDIYPDVYVRAVNLDMPVPSVIALREYAPTGKARPAFTRRNVFLRDGYRCQYCSGLFRTSDLSLDHVEPRCMGGKLTWDNTVTCCKKCNGRKGCLRPTEIHRVGMQLQSTPRCPSLFELAAEATKFVPRRVHPTWAPFLGLSEKPAEEEEYVHDGEGGASSVKKERQQKKKKKKSQHLQ